jgi:hypothetical protein
MKDLFKILTIGSLIVSTVMVFGLIGAITHTEELRRGIALICSIMGTVTFGSCWWGLRRIPKSPSKSLPKDREFIERKQKY